MVEHYCTEHDTRFFKGGKMKSFAHPIEVNGQTVGWCNEDDITTLAEEVAKLPARKAVSPPLQEGEPISSLRSHQASSMQTPTDKGMSKGDWAEKDRIKQQSIERQKALGEAVNWCAAKLQAGEEVKTTHIIAIAVIFASFVENGAVEEERKSNERTR